MKAGPIDWQGLHAGMPTLHGKAAILQNAFAEWQWEVAPIPVDTNRFGTFAGDVERTLSPAEAARAKIVAAIQAMQGLPVYIGSEGSFYPHPQVPMLTLNTELLALYHAATDRWFEASYTDYFGPAGQLRTRSWEALLAFAEPLAFPEQSLLLMTSEADKKRRQIVKDFENLADLEAAFFQLVKSGEVIAEPDLRAHRSPRRRQHILMAAAALKELLACQCPQCSSPGFSKKTPVPGLPCSWCGTPTRLTKAWLQHCAVCQYEATLPVAAAHADPGSCDVCNP